jgi:hypothetical protein
MWNGLQIIKAVIDVWASIRVLDRSYIDLTTPMGRGLLLSFDAVLVHDRTKRPNGRQAQ